MRRAGDAGLEGVAHRCFPDLLGARRIDRHQPAIAGTDVHLAFPRRHTAVGSRGVRTIQRKIQADMRIEFPEQFSRGRIHRIDLGKRCAHVGDAVDHDRLGNHAHLSLDVQVPSKTQLIDVLVIDLLQRAEMRGIDECGR